MSLRSIVMLGAVVFFGVLAGSVTIQAQRIEGQHQIDRIEADTVAAIERNRSLRSQVAVAESPARIMAEARALEMVEPGTPVPLVTSGSQHAEDPAVGEVAPLDGAADAGAMTMAAHEPAASEGTR